MLQQSNKNNTELTISLQQVKHMKDASLGALSPQAVNNNHTFTWFIIDPGTSYRL